MDRQLKLDPVRRLYRRKLGVHRYGAAIRTAATSPDGHRKTTSLGAAAHRTGIVAPMALNGPINRDALVAYARQMLAPDLSPDDIVIWTICRVARRPPSLRQPKQRLDASPRLTTRNSTQSSRRSPSPMDNCAKPPSASSTASGMPSPASSTSSRLQLRQLLRQRRI